MYVNPIPTLHAVSLFSLFRNQHIKSSSQLMLSSRSAARLFLLTTSFHIQRAAPSFVRATFVVGRTETSKLIATMTTETNSSGSNTNTGADKKGSYVRLASKHRHAVSQLPGGDFPSESGRYHLHVALACPWACGTLAALRLKGLDDAISHSVVHPTWGKTNLEDDADQHFGWVYRRTGDDPLPNPLGYGSNRCDEALIPDAITNARSIREVYELCGDFQGPFTTPLLFDKKTERIVSNESTDILKMLNSEFNSFAKNPEVDLYPEDIEDDLVSLNDSIVYPKVNNGVYRCGFARSQDAYDTAVVELFAALDTLEGMLAKKRYLGGRHFTWLDLRLFMTLVRFDPVYTTYFKTNQRRIADYPSLLGFVRDVYSIAPVRSSINMDHIKVHYYTSHPTLNTFGIIPIGNGPDLEIVDHGREEM